MMLRTYEHIIRFNVGSCKKGLFGIISIFSHEFITDNHGVNMTFAIRTCVLFIGHNISLIQNTHTHVHIL